MLTRNVENEGSAAARLQVWNGHFGEQIVEVSKWMGESEKLANGSAITWLSTYEHTCFNICKHMLLIAADV